MSRVNALLILLALLAAGLVSALHSLGQARIHDQQQAAVERAMLDLLPAAAYDNRPLSQPIALSAGGLLTNNPARPAYLAMLNSKPSVVLLPVTARGYNGEIQLLVAIDTHGRLIGSKVLVHRETAGLGDRIEASRSAWLSGFKGMTLNDKATRWTLVADGGQFDQMTGATITSRAVREALQRALRFFDARRDYLLSEPSR